LPCPLERIIALRDQVNELGGRLDTIVTEGPER
jgi:hypothetical protein